MDQLEQNQAAIREDMTTVKDQISQLVEALQALARGQNEMRQTTLRVATANPAIVTTPKKSLGGAGTPVIAQPPPERGPMYQNVAQTFNIPVNGRAQPEIDDHQDAFFTMKADLVYDAFGPSAADLERRFCMMEERFKEMEGPDTFGLDNADICSKQPHEGKHIYSAKVKVAIDLKDWYLWDCLVNFFPESRPQAMGE
ncbi:hypothetical protein KIW84_021652 [Lathyrus oleraceus]|uniref:Uncharacterized protein n=1 Tax=Pisum sativum TaxID=3888 RepID=A0A9D4Y9K5_PEA|nr:hypothetical protein KIW84_021652 [Pisum sativum]